MLPIELRDKVLALVQSLEIFFTARVAVYCFQVQLAGELLQKSFVTQAAFVDGCFPRHLSELKLVATSRAVDLVCLVGEVS